MDVSYSSYLQPCSEQTYHINFSHCTTTPVTFIFLHTQDSSFFCFSLLFSTLSNRCKSRPLTNGFQPSLICCDALLQLSDLPNVRPLHFMFSLSFALFFCLTYLLLSFPHSSYQSWVSSLITELHLLLWHCREIPFDSTDKCLMITPFCILFFLSSWNRTDEHFLNMLH